MYFKSLNRFSQSSDLLSPSNSISFLFLSIISLIRAAALRLFSYLDLHELNRKLQTITMKAIIIKGMVITSSARPMTKRTGNSRHAIQQWSLKIWNERITSIIGVARTRKNGATSRNSMKSPSLRENLTQRPGGSYSIWPAPQLFGENGIKWPES